MDLSRRVATANSPPLLHVQVLINEGYDGLTADFWSCGVILYVLMARSPLLKKMIFQPRMTRRLGAKSLIHRILDPNPKTVSNKKMVLYSCCLEKTLIF